MMKNIHMSLAWELIILRVKIAQVKQNFINLWILCLDHLRI